MVYGATADFGFNAIKDTLSIRDLHVWIIHLIGVGYKELTRAVDDGAEPGRFLLAGSATPGDSAIHSSLGRIVTLRMRPLSALERQLETATVSLATLLARHEAEHPG